MRELLIRYLLGELAEDERLDLEQQLADSPQLRRELAHLKACFSAGCQCDQPAADPPSGLAERTADIITGHSDETHQLPPRPVTSVAEPANGELGWSLADLTVAGGVMLALSMLLFPALGDSRDATRRNVCQNNQRQLWLLVTRHAEDHGGYYPRLNPDDNAGSFAVQLAEKGYIPPSDLALLLVCPGAPLADAIRSGQFVMRVPTPAQLRAMSPSELEAAKRNMSPFYAYRFPYRVGDRYVDIRDERRPLSPVFADTASARADGRVSPNHGGSIVQVLCQDGSVKSLRSRTVPGMQDDLFLNAIGLVAAGVDRNDTVLGRSEATPAFAFPPATSQP